MPGIRDDHDGITEVFFLQDLLTEKEIFSRSCRTVFLMDPLRRDAHADEFPVHALGLGDRLVCAFSAGYDTR